MALSITHPTVATGADDPSKEINKGEWNAAHSIAGLGTGVETALGVNVGSAGAVVVNGGALGTPSSGTLTNATGLPVGGISATGTPGAGNFLRGDGTWAAASGSSTWDTIGAATGDATTANGDNNIVYQVAKTTNSEISFRFTESAAATNGTSTGGVPNQVLLQLDTVASSTMSPLKVMSRGSFVFAVSPTTAQILANAGSSSAPVYSFSGSASSGMWLQSGGLRFGQGSNLVMVMEPTVTQIYGSGRVVVEWKPASAGGGWQIMDEADSNPTTTELDATDSFAMYMKGDKLVFAYNLAGTMNYIAFTLDGSTTTFTNSTSAP